MAGKITSRITSLREGVTVKTKVLASLTILSLVGVIGVTGTVASFENKATTTAVIQAGSIDINFEEKGSVTPSAQLDLGIYKWFPGAVVNKDIVLVNKGSVPALISLNTSGANTSSLAYRLRVTYTFKGKVLGYAGANQRLSTGGFGGNDRVIIPPDGNRHIINAKINWPSGLTDADNADHARWLGKDEQINFNFLAEGLPPGTTT